MLLNADCLRKEFLESTITIRQKVINLILTLELQPAEHWLVKMLLLESLIQEIQMYSLKTWDTHLIFLHP